MPGSESIRTGSNSTGELIIRIYNEKESKEKPNANRISCRTMMRTTKIEQREDPKINIAFERYDSFVYCF